MKRLVLMLLCVVALSAEDSPLVKAAKSGAGTKKKSTKKVITNADVRKGGGKITELPARTSAAPAPKAEPAKSSITKRDEQLRASAAAAKRVSTAEAKVKSLEGDLARIEQNYYESTDPTYRDTTIKQRFEQTKLQLDDARKELAEARDVQLKLKPKS
jgi:hypothetical protein